MKARTPLLGLTPRERDILRYIVGGKTNREIARELDLGEQAVKNVLTTVYQKYHVRNRLELALFAMEHHLLVDASATSKKKKYGRGLR
jgi:two-component system nitrate/nitrite response regulator NarL